MKDAWLIIDCNYICRRAYYALGDALTHGDIRTGMIYGFMRDIVGFMDLHGSDRVVFCFDTGPGLRVALVPTYKKKRKEAEAALTGKDLKNITEYHTQVNKLRRRYLYECGFRNIFYEDGYEADDVMASLCTETLPKEDDIILITADKDMYQCLSDRVIIWEPRTRNILTIAGFIKAYGINPDQWAEVKAIAGCLTDDVAGVRGVGEATAIAYIRGELKPGKKLQAIQEAYRSGLVKQNRRLVRLPYRGCPVFELSTDEVTADKWATLANRLGMRSLAGHAPISGRAARRKPTGFICG